MDSLIKHFHSLKQSNTTDFQDLYHELIIYESDFSDVYNWTALIANTMNVLDNRDVENSIHHIKFELSILCE
jgi:hypothetical protein